MGRRSKKSSINPEVEAAFINAQATMAGATIQARASRHAAFISLIGGGVIAVVAGICGLLGSVVTAIPTAQAPPGTVTETAQPRTKPSLDTSNLSEAIKREQLLANVEEYAAHVLSQDCLSYPEGDQRVHCHNEKLVALVKLREAREATSGVKVTRQMDVVTTP